MVEKLFWNEGKEMHSVIYNDEQFRKVIEIAPMALALLTQEGKIEYVNRMANELFGYTVDDINCLDNWWIKAYPDEEYRQSVKSAWLKKVGTLSVGMDRSKGEEYIITCKNGNKKTILIYEALVIDKILVLFEDITERKKIEKALLESEQHYRMITELTSDYVYKLAVAPDGKITMDYVSDNFPSITGRNKKDAQTVELWKNFIYPEDYPLLIDSLKELIARPASYEIECRSFIHGEKLRWIHCVSRSYWDEKEKRVTTIIGAVKDISERKWAELLIQEKNRDIEKKNQEYAQLNEELIEANLKLKTAKEKAEESDRLKTSFLQNMSHEIRTPMNAIMGFSSLLKDNFDNREKLEKFAEIINGRCNDLLEIINDILDIAKIESGQMSVNKETCHLDEIFEELRLLFEEYRIKIGKESIEFSMFTCCKNHNTIVTDQLKLKQILINLISNAFKFTNKGKIECRCQTSENNTLLFTVSDTGIGIPSDKFDLIFERFSQVSDNRIQTLGGTGLGLSIVKGLISLLKGKIWLTSQLSDEDKGIEGGTTFYFVLPLD